MYVRPIKIFSKRLILFRPKNDFFIYNGISGNFVENKN
jgi:hypothetical protein